MSVVDFLRAELHVWLPYKMENGVPTSITYGYPEFKVEVAGWIARLGMEMVWQPVTPCTLDDILARTAARHRERPVIVFNLCDGLDIDGYPGPAVVRALTDAGIPFTGADLPFYDITTPKSLMKRRMLERGVSTKPFVEIKDAERDARRAVRELGLPFLYKPDISAASFGISLKSVIREESAAVDQAKVMLAQQRDSEDYWDGVIAEPFVVGREFTVLMASDPKEEKGVYVYPPVERVFHSSLPPLERLLSYDRYWSYFKEESRMPDDKPVAHYESAPSAFAPRLRALARQAFLCLDGVAYGRCDIRYEEATDTFFVLEVNCNCGLSTDGETSASWILSLSGEPIDGFLARIFDHAVRRDAERIAAARGERGTVVQFKKRATAVSSRGSGEEGAKVARKKRVAKTAAASA
jgi:D-alanine-D-alanine ligase-like ATP-grasp enzyme